MLPLTRTKAGPGEKEPAYLILRHTFCKFFACLVCVGLIVALKLYSDAESYEHVKVRVHGLARKFEQAESSHSKAHAEMAKVGEEFDQHLDRDMRELQVGPISSAPQLPSILRLLLSGVGVSLQTNVITPALHVSGGPTPPQGPEDDARDL